jgi:hypothetical protein
MAEAITTSLRMPRETHEILSRVCKIRNETNSNFIRRAILRELALLGFLNKEQSKAFGVVMHRARGNV